MVANKNNLKKLIKTTQNIDGWLSSREGVFLYHLASQLPANSTIVEIGSWKGKSAVWLANAVKNKAETKVYAVDPHIGSPEQKDEYGKIDTFSEFTKNIEEADLSRTVIPIRKSSQETATVFKKSVDLLFIDGSHEFAEVKNDFILWKKKLERGGWVVMHDATVLPGPWKVTRNEIIFSGNFQQIGMLGSMVFGQYLPNCKWLERIVIFVNNFIAYLYIISYVMLRKVPFPKNWRQRARQYNFKRGIKSFNS